MTMSPRCRSNPLYRSHGGVKLVRARTQVQQMCKLADVVTTPSAILADRFRQLGARDVRVLPNCVADHYLATQRSKHDRVVVGWVAGVEHQIDYQRLI